MVFRVGDADGEDLQGVANPEGERAGGGLAERAPARDRLRGYLPDARNAAVPGEVASHGACRQPADGGVPALEAVPEGAGRRRLLVGDGGLSFGGRRPLHPRPLRRHRAPRRGGVAGTRGVSGEDDEGVSFGMKTNTLNIVY